MPSNSLKVKRIRGVESYFLKDSMHTEDQCFPVAHGLVTEYKEGNTCTLVVLFKPIRGNF